MVKIWTLVVCALLAACGSKGSSKQGAGSGSASSAGLTRVPKVTVASTIVANPANPPPVLILLDDKGALFANHLKTWDELATKDPMVGAQPTTFERAYSRLAEGRVMAQAPDRIYESFKPVGPGEVDLESLEDEARPYLATDDPPPPEEEDIPDDGEDESGGTGTAMAIEEGKMGKRDADRAEGQYKMQKEYAAPELVARQQQYAARLALAKVAGGRQPGKDKSRPGIATPQTTATVEVIKDGKLQQPAYALLLAAPKAKALAFIDVIEQLRPWVAVAHEGKLRPLRLETIPEREYWDKPRRWIELRVGTTDLAFEAVPDAPIALTGALDQTAFAAALAKARDSRKLDPLARVDVLVEDPVEVQRLVDVLVALDQAGVVMIGLGRVPPAGSEEAKLRGTRRTEIRVGQPVAIGDLDKAVIRSTIAAQLDALRTCFDKAYAKNPALAGTVTTTFTVAPTGKVKSPATSGVDPAVASCVSGVMFWLQFPKRKGGGIEVNVPITFDP